MSEPAGTVARRSGLTRCPAARLRPAGVYAGHHLLYMSASDKAGL